MHVISIPMLMVLMLSGGGSGDLLSFLPTDTYWQRQGVPIVSVDSMTAYMTIDEQDKAAVGAATQKVRQLMAIRALGEIGNKTAIDDLQPLTESDEPFVAEYARRAIARLKGEKYTPPSVTEKQLQHDLMALPQGVTILGQFRNDARKLTLDQLLQDVPAGPMMPEPAEIKKHMLDTLIEVAHHAGNVRLDSVTFAIVGNPERDGHGVILFRGAYDRAAFNALMKREGVESEQVADQTVYRETDTMIAPLDNSRLIMLFGEQRDTLPVKDMLAAAKTGDGGLADDKALMGRINEMERKDAMAWASIEVMPWMNEMPVLRSFETMNVTAHIEGEGEQQQAALHLQGSAKDADTAAGAVDRLKLLIKQWQNMAQRGMQRQPEMKPVIDPYITMMENIKLNSDGPTATLETKMPRINPALLLVMWATPRAAMPPDMERNGRIQQVAPEEAPDDPALN